jgi:hypothetical protein
MLLGKDLKREYDYLGVIKDRTYFHEFTMSMIQKECQKGYDAVFLPVVHWPLDVYPQPEQSVYDDPVVFFRDYGVCTANLETVFFRRDTLLKNIDRDGFLKKYYIHGECCFEQMAMLFEQLAKVQSPQIRVLREKETISYSSKKSFSMWEESIFHIWGELWPSVVDRLPECYNRYKPYIKKRQTMQPPLFGSIKHLRTLKEKGILTEETLGQIGDIWQKLSDIPVECLIDILHDRYDLALRRIAGKWRHLVREQKFPQAYHFFYANPLAAILGKEDYMVLHKCFEIYEKELAHQQSDGIFRGVHLYTEAVDKYRTMKYMLRRLEFDVAEEIEDMIVPYFQEQKITPECLSYIIDRECYDKEKVMFAWKRLWCAYEEECFDGKS